MRKSGCAVSARKYQIIDLETVDFGDFLKIQDRLWGARVNEKITDTIVFAEHPAAISIVRHHRLRDLANIRVGQEALGGAGIRIFEVGRGGGTALHAPGILGCYAILKNVTPRSIADFLYAWISSSLSMAGVNLDYYPDCWGERQKELPVKDRVKYSGYWMNDKKIGFWGVKISQDVSTFGTNLNVCPDKELLSLVHPCGITDYPSSSISSETGEKFSTEDVKILLMSKLLNNDKPR